MTPRVSLSELMEPYARYSFGVDNQHAEVIGSCFTSDASLGPVGQPPTSGRTAIVERLMRIADPAVVHHAFNIVMLDASPDEVVARADFTMAKHGSIIATGHYDDTLTTLPQTGWVFSRRAVTYIWRASSE